MGTLTSQLPRWDNLSRKEDLASWIQRVQHACEETGIKPSDDSILAAALAGRELHFRVSDWDIKDEQLAGFGELLQGLIYAIENLKEDA